MIYEFANDMEVANFRISKTPERNFGEILVQDFDDGLLRIPAHVDEPSSYDMDDDRSVASIMSMFNIPVDVLKLAGFASKEEAANNSFIEVPIKYNGHRLNKMMEHARNNRVLNFGKFFNDATPTEKLNMLKEQGYYIIIHF